MPTTVCVSFEFAGQTHEDVALTHGLRSPFAGRKTARQADEEPGTDWSIDLPVVLAMLAAVQRGDATAGSARDLLLAAIAKTTERSGCCLHCESALDAYELALREYHEAVRLHEQRAAGMTRETYPFLVNTNAATVHTCDCSMAPSEHIPHPGNSVREFIHGRSDGEYGPGVFGYQAVSQALRMTPEELTAWVRSRRGPKGALNYKRCRSCQPMLPFGYSSEATG